MPEKPSVPFSQMYAFQASPKQAPFFHACFKFATNAIGTIFVFKDTVANNSNGLPTHLFPFKKVHGVFLHQGKFFSALPGVSSFLPTA